MTDDDLPDDPRELLLYLMTRDGRAMEWVSKHLGRNKAYVHQYLTRFKPKRLDELDRAKLGKLFDVPPDRFLKPDERKLFVKDSVTDAPHNNNRGEKGGSAVVERRVAFHDELIADLISRLRTLEAKVTELEGASRHPRKRG